LPSWTRVHQGTPLHHCGEVHYRRGCVVRTLAALFEERGEPAFIRCDNRPEFIAKALKRWLDVSGVVEARS
jgi:hypothetical protein